MALYLLINFVIHSHLNLQKLYIPHLIFEHHNFLYLQLPNFLYYNTLFFHLTQVLELNFLYCLLSHHLQRLFHIQDLFFGIICWYYKTYHNYSFLVLYRFLFCNFNIFFIFLLIFYALIKNLFYFF